MIIKIAGLSDILSTARQLDSSQLLLIVLSERRARLLDERRVVLG